MRDYVELVKALRFAFEQPCCDCVLGEKCNWGDFCFFKRSADAIEELLAEVKHWELEAAANKTDRNYLIDENRKLVNSLMNFRVPTWISVEERLPESGERVLIMFEPFEDDENISIGWLTKSGFDCYDDSVYFFRSVTHWMPLPEPPKEVE